MESFIEVFFQPLFIHIHLFHIDIKGSNILVENSGVCKLSDFGSSRVLSSLNDNGNPSLTGTANWMSPEVIKQQTTSRYVSSLYTFYYYFLIIL